MANRLAVLQSMPVQKPLGVVVSPTFMLTHILVKMITMAMTIIMMIMMIMIMILRIKTMIMMMMLNMIMIHDCPTSM